MTPLKIHNGGSYALVEAIFHFSHGQSLLNFLILPPISFHILNMSLRRVIYCFCETIIIT